MPDTITINDQDYEVADLNDQQKYLIEQKIEVIKSRPLKDKKAVIKKKITKYRKMKVMIEAINLSSTVF